MNNKILMIIDGQYSFINGTLAVKGATEKMDNLCEFIRENAEMYDQIILTADWHPITHMSFSDNGGQWPTHCVQHTVGAAIYEPLMEALNKSKVDYVILTKGTDEDREEYSVFRNEVSKKIILDTCKALETKDIDFVGIAMDYCVKDSILDGKRELPNVNMHLYKDFSPCIGDEEATLKDLENNGVHII